MHEKIISLQTFLGLYELCRPYLRLTKRKKKPSEMAQTKPPILNSNMTCQAFT